MTPLEKIKSALEKIEASKNDEDCQACGSNYLLQNEFTRLAKAVRVMAESLDTIRSTFEIDWGEAQMRAGYVLSECAELWEEK